MSFGEHLKRAFKEALEAVTVVVTVGNIDVKLSEIKSILDKLTFDSEGNLYISIKGSEIQVPVDIQGSLIAYDSGADLFKASIERDNIGLTEHVYSQKIDVDETVDQEVTLDTKHHRVVDIYAKATAATTFTVDLSNDGTNWVNYYTSEAAETEYKDTIITGFRYIRLKSAAAGASGDKVTLILCAK